MLEAITQLGLPLDRIVHAEVWATDTISADLPPMVEFKKYADKIIKERYGIDVEHTCATRKRKRGGGENRVQTENVANKNLHTSDTSTGNDSTENCNDMFCMDSPANEEAGVKTSSPEAVELEKLTYEKLFYHIPNRKSSKTSGGAILDRNNHRISNQRSELLPQSQDGCNSTSGDLTRSTRRMQSEGSLSAAGCSVGATASREIQSERWISGFPRPINWCNSGLKREAIHSAFSTKPQHKGQKINIVQYLGIAADEPERIERHTKEGIILPLVEIGWDEAYCRQWCEENGLLSPIYTTATRGGCWFCHNQGVDQLRLLRKDYPDLWALLMKWDLDSPVTFKSDGHTVHDYDLRFQAEEEIGIPKDRKFRWKMLEDYHPTNDEGTSD